MVLNQLARVRVPSFGRNVAVVATGTAVAQAIPIVLTPILTRLYAPDDMGMLGLYTAFISFATNALSLGYSQAIVSGRTDDEAAALTALSGVVLVPMSLFSIGLFSLFSAQDWLGFGEFPVWTIPAMLLSLVFTGLFFTLRYWLIREESYRTISTSTVKQSIGRMGTQVLAGIVGLQWVGLVLGEVVGRGTGLTGLWAEAGTRLRHHVGKLDRSTLKQVAKRYRKFPLLTTPSSVLNSLSLVLPVPLITMFFGIHAAGQFTVASRVMLLPLSVIGGSVGDVFHSRIASLSRRAPNRAMRLFLSVAFGLFLVGLLPALVMSAWGQDIFSLVLGKEWSDSGLIASSIVPWVLMQFTVNPLSRLVQVYQGQELKLVYDTLALISVGGVLTFGYYADWSVIETTTLLGWSQASVYGIYLLLLVRILIRNRMINATLEKDESNAP